ncbi:MAG: ABC transporter substrate-binding protein [Nitrospinota bacterium]|nr:MAG: ABC transporter substrate-binding protein [Nitrospinota bacterium]
MHNGYRSWGVRVVCTLMVVGLWILPVRAAEFRIAVGIDPDTLDPAQMTTTTVANIVDYVVETLTKLAPDGSVQPYLAERWSASADGLQYTFTLRKGVTFHDGTPFDAQAVKWNFDRLKDPTVRVPIRAPYPIEQTEIVDASTVRVTLKRPFVPFISALSWTTAGLVSPGSVNKKGNSYKNYTHIVGTGPYRFESRKKGERISMTRFEGYWGPKPYYDRVVFRIVPEAATRESLLLAGQADLTILPPVADIPALQSNSAVKVLLAPSDRTIFIAINTQDPLLKDRRVRQALNYAVDKEAIIKNVLFGAADPMDAPMAPSLFGYCKAGRYEFDQAKAKQLLADAGVAPGTKISLIHPTGRYVQDKEATQAIAGYLREVGLEPQIQTMDWPSYVRTIITPLDKGNKTQLHYLGWAPAFLDASQQVLQFLSTYAPPNGLETTFYRNPQVDEWIRAAESESSPEKRKELYCKISRQVWEDAPWIFLWVQRFPIIYSAKVTGVGSLPNEKFDAVYARPAQ